jgi:VIT1/CCC1 family predicted Fe2+/Mn2+ transporter
MLPVTVATPIHHGTVSTPATVISLAMAQALLGAVGGASSPHVDQAYRGLKALSPVISRPTIKLWMASVPS